MKQFGTVNTACTTALCSSSGSNKKTPVAHLTTLALATLLHSCSKYCTALHQRVNIHEQIGMKLTGIRFG